MSIIKKIGIGVVAVAAAVVAGGFLAPDQLSIKRQILVDASPREVLDLATSNSGYQSFNPYKNTDPNLKITLQGPAHGVGSGFAFDGKDGKGSQKIVAVSARHVDYHIAIDGMGEVRQAIHTTPTTEGTLVEWHMGMDLGNNPVMRLMGLVMPAMMNPTLDTGLANLKKIANEA